MKTLLTLAMVALLSVMVNADPGSRVDYIKTKDGKVVIAKVGIGLINMRAKQNDGTLLKINYNDVTSFQKNGQLYERKPLYNDNKNSGHTVFMRFLSYRNGLALYCYDEPTSSRTSSSRYFVFKDGEKFWLEVTERNSETIKAFFNRTTL